MRGKENAFRSALKDADTAKDAYLAKGVTFKAGDVLNNPPVACDRVAAIVEEHHERRSVTGR